MPNQNSQSYDFMVFKYILIIMMMVILIMIFIILLWNVAGRCCDVRRSTRCWFTAVWWTRNYEKSVASGTLHTDVTPCQSSVFHADNITDGFCLSCIILCLLQAEPPNQLYSLIYILGDCSCADAGPRPWNSLPVHLVQPDLRLGQFLWALKTHQFVAAWLRHRM